MILETQTVGETWVPAGPGGQMVPTPQQGQVARACGFRYHEGSMTESGMPRCQCGTFSIALCKSCDAAVCGDHSRLVEGARLCLTCAQRRLDVQQASADATAAAAAQRKADAREARDAAITAIADPIERLLAVAASVEVVQPVPGFGAPPRPDSLPGWNREIARLCPNLRSYDGPTVARWFAKRAVEIDLQGGEYVPAFERKNWFRGRYVATELPVRAWSFPCAIEQHTRWGAAPASTLYILEDGRMFTDNARTEAQVERPPSTTVTEIPPVILHKMAVRLGMGSTGALSRSSREGT